MFTSKLGISFGFIVFLAGLVFHFQGHGMVGPESSFMYSNPDWITYGQQIAIVGLVILGIVVLFSFRKKFKQ